MLPAKGLNVPLHLAPTPSTFPAPGVGGRLAPKCCWGRAGHVHRDSAGIPTAPHRPTVKTSECQWVGGKELPFFTQVEAPAVAPEIPGYPVPALTQLP